MTEANIQGARDELVARFLAVFPDPGWPERRQLAHFPSDVDSREIAHLRANFAGRRWRDVSDDALVYLGSDFGTLNREALAYFLPAFFVCYLKHWNGLAQDLSLYFTPMLGILSPLADVGFTREQLEVVHDFLVWWENDGLEEDFEPIRRWQSRIRSEIDS